MNFHLKKNKFQINTSCPWPKNIWPWPFILFNIHHHYSHSSLAGLKFFFKLHVPVIICFVPLLFKATYTKHTTFTVSARNKWHNSNKSNYKNALISTEIWKKNKKLWSLCFYNITWSPSFTRESLTVHTFPSIADAVFVFCWH